MRECEREKVRESEEKSKAVSLRTYGIESNQTSSVSHVEQVVERGRERYIERERERYI